MFRLIVQMYKTEGGWLALYRGIVPTIAGVAPYVSSLFGLRSMRLPKTGRLELHDIRRAT